MELAEKIRKLRKAHHMTQEQLAAALFVSRTAVSKWETGRGMPSMESLRQLASLFQVTLDQLLSAEEAALPAQAPAGARFAHWESILHLLALFGLLLPLYKVEESGVFRTVPLYQLGGWQGVALWIAPVLMILCGLMQLLLTDERHQPLCAAARWMGVTAHVSAILLLIACGHPYPAALFFLLFALRGLPRLKNPQ